MNVDAAASKPGPTPPMPLTAAGTPGRGCGWESPGDRCGCPPERRYSAAGPAPAGGPASPPVESSDRHARSAATTRGRHAPAGSRQGNTGGWQFGQVENGRQFHLVQPISLGFPGGPSGKEPACQYRQMNRRGFAPWVGKIPWRRKWQPIPVFLPREPHGLSLAGYIQSMGSQESDMT